MSDVQWLLWRQAGKGVGESDQELEIEAEDDLPLFHKDSLAGLTQKEDRLLTTTSTEALTPTPSRKKKPKKTPTLKRSAVTTPSPPQPKRTKPSKPTVQKVAVKHLPDFDVDVVVVEVSIPTQASFQAYVLATDGVVVVLGSWDDAKPRIHLVNMCSLSGQVKDAIRAANRSEALSRERSQYVESRLVEDDFLAVKIAQRPVDNVQSIGPETAGTVETLSTTCDTLEPGICITPPGPEVADAFLIIDSPFKGLVCDKAMKETLLSIVTYRRTDHKTKFVVSSQFIPHCEKWDDMQFSNDLKKVSLTSLTSNGEVQRWRTIDSQSVWSCFFCSDSVRVNGNQRMPLISSVKQVFTCLYAGERVSSGANPTSVEDAYALCRAIFKAPERPTLGAMLVCNGQPAAWDPQTFKYCQCSVLRKDLPSPYNYIYSRRRCTPKPLQPSTKSTKKKNKKCTKASKKKTPRPSPKNGVRNQILLY